MVFCGIKVKGSYNPVLLWRLRDKANGTIIFHQAP